MAKPRMMYEVTSADTGTTVTLSEAEARKTFGGSEWKEIKAGYLPHLIVCRLGLAYD